MRLAGQVAIVTGSGQTIVADGGRTDDML